MVIGIAGKDSEKLKLEHNGDMKPTQIELDGDYT